MTFDDEIKLAGRVTYVHRDRDGDQLFRCPDDRTWWLVKSNRYTAGPLKPGMTGTIYYQQTSPTSGRSWFEPDASPTGSP